MKKGFTLIELLVSIAIMVILTGIVFTGVISTRSRGRDAKKIADTQSLALALETYFSKNRHYPRVLTDAELKNYIAKDPSTMGITYISLFKTTFFVECDGTPATEPWPNFYHMGVQLENSVNVDRAGKKTSVDYPTSGTIKYPRCGDISSIDGVSDAKMYDQIPSF